MAYVVARGPDRFEIRETVRTERGPRARTLATFRELTPGVVARAGERGRGPIDGDGLRRSARRVGAVVTEAAVEVAAAQLYRELSDGAQLRPALARLIAAALAETGEPTDAERAAGAWLACSPLQRGRALHDLLALADRLPAAERGADLGFPRLQTTR